MRLILSDPGRGMEGGAFLPCRFQQSRPVAALSPVLYRLEHFQRIAGAAGGERTSRLSASREEKSPAEPAAGLFPGARKQGGLAGQGLGPAFSMLRPEGGAWENITRKTNDLQVESRIPRYPTVARIRIQVDNPAAGLENWSDFTLGNQEWHARHRRRKRGESREHARGGIDWTFPLKRS